MKHKFLPSLQQPNDFLYVINHVFYLKTDHLWVERIDKDLWKNFFELLGIQINLTNPVILRQLNQAMQILSYRVTTLGLEREITDYFNDQKDAIHPFLEQNKLVNMYMERQFSMRLDEKRLLLYNVQENLYNCRKVFVRSRSKGVIMEPAWHKPFLPFACNNRLNACSSL
jgi:site-specific recombinase